MLTEYQQIEEVCTPILVKLIVDEYRSNFSDSVLSICCDALEGKWSDRNSLSGKFWDDGCTGALDYKGLQRAGLLKFSRYSEEFLRLFSRAQEEEKKDGCFEMPDWGTRGT